MQKDTKYSKFLVKTNEMLILIWFYIKDVSNLCTGLVQVYFDSAKYGIKKWKAIIHMLCHLTLAALSLESQKVSNPSELNRGLWYVERLPIVSLKV